MRRVLAAVMAGAILSACGSVLAPPAAIVDDHKISVQDVTGALDRFRGTPQFTQAAQQSGASVISRQFEQDYLASLIRRYVLNARAREMGIEVDPSDVQRAMAKIRGNFPNQAAFRKALGQQALTLERLRQLIRDRVLERKLHARVTGDVARSQQDSEWQHWLVAAYQAAGVNVNPSFGTFDPKTQQITDKPRSFPGAPPASPRPVSSPSLPG